MGHLWTCTDSQYTLFLSQTRPVAKKWMYHYIRQTKTHWIRLKKYTQKCGGTSSNGFHIGWIISTQGNWKNQSPGSCFGATSWIVLPIWSIWPNFEVMGWIGSVVKLVAPNRLPGFSFFQLFWVPNIHFMWNPLLLMPPHFLSILFQS
jgi:hypothetical protein